MKTAYLILIAITAFTGCTKKGTDHTAPLVSTMTKDTTATATTDSLHYLALGDSYTIGEAVPLNESFPYQLAAKLTISGHTTAFPKIIAVTGWTTDELISAIARSGITDKKFDFVTLLIGVNDQFQGMSQDNYRIKFQQVLNTAITFAGGYKNHVFVLSIPDYGVTPFANGQDNIIGPQIDQFNGINQQISTAAGVNYLDITAISRQAATDPSLIAPDGLHPSPGMYALWDNLLEPSIIENLKKN